MSGLEIPERAGTVGRRAYWDDQSEDFDDRVDSALHSAAPIIVAAELRRQANDLHELRRTIRDEDGRGIRSSAMAEGISRLRTRADELDPGGST